LHEGLGEPTIAETILDRPLAGAHRIDLWVALRPADRDRLAIGHDERLPIV
jgi:hypothetical protein